MLKIILFSSMVGAIGIAMIGFIVLQFRVKKLKVEANKDNQDIGRLKVFENKNKGVILKELKADAINPLPDNLMIFLVDTFVRNSYTTANFVGFQSEYEKDSLVRNAGAKINEEKFDLLIMNAGPRTTSELNTLFSKLSEKGMVFIVNLKDGHALISDIEHELIMKKHRFELQKWAKWFFVIAKD